MNRRVDLSSFGPSAKRQVDAFLTAEALVKERKPSKYKNKRVLHEGVWFDSKAELSRWLDLKILLNAGVIQDLQRQVRFKIYINETEVCTYVADHVYTMTDGGHKLVEDVKGCVTKEYALKKKLMRAVHGIEITEIRR